LEVGAAKILKERESKEKEEAKVVVGDSMVKKHPGGKSQHLMRSPFIIRNPIQSTCM